MLPDPGIWTRALALPRRHARRLAAVRVRAVRAEPGSGDQPSSRWTSRATPAGGGRRRLGATRSGRSHRRSAPPIRSRPAGPAAARAAVAAAARRAPRRTARAAEEAVAAGTAAALSRFSSRATTRTPVPTTSCPRGTTHRSTSPCSARITRPPGALRRRPLVRRLLRRRRVVDARDGRGARRRPLPRHLPAAGSRHDDRLRIHSHFRRRQRRQRARADDHPGVPARRPAARQRWRR